MKKTILIYPLLGLTLSLVNLSCNKAVVQSEPDVQPVTGPGFYTYFFSSHFGRITFIGQRDSSAPKQDPPLAPPQSPPETPPPVTPPPPPPTTPPTTPPVTPPVTPPPVTPPPPPDSTLTSVDTSQAPPPPTPQAPAAPFPTNLVSGCAYAPNYGDSIIFPQPTSGQDYIVHPVNNPGPGKYLSWPVGLSLDSITGAIDLTKSETGMRYDIGFVANGSSDTCINQLIVGGAAYMDSVYVLDNGQTKAYPYYNANAYLPPVCSGGSGCTFDVTGSAANQKVIIDKATGVIDLQKTLNGGLLGGAFGLIPLDGQSIATRIYYRLNDPSNNALQHIDVQIAYFAKKSLLGVGLLGSITGALDSILSGNVISTSINPRPPLVVIVRHN